MQIYYNSQYQPNKYKEYHLCPKPPPYLLVEMAEHITGRTESVTPIIWEKRYGTELTKDAILSV